MNGSKLDARFFRHEYGRLVAMLSRRLGMRHLDAVEDAAQSALLAALESWTKGSVPDNPSAWLSRAAHNHVVGELRARARRERLAEQHGNEATDATTHSAPAAFLAGDVRNDLVRMLFACCDDSIPVESQLVIALKTLCGFDVREIAERLFTTEANVYKRLGRARSRLRELPFEPDELEVEQLSLRLPAVLSILYLLFTEGYLSSHADGAIRRELCDDAKRLTQLLAEHSASATPETFALLALMHLHSARITARQDAAGGLLLLEEQDRSVWDQREIQLGLSWLARSAEGDAFCRYHAEAGVAAEHCLAPSFAETRWDRIVECYALLEQLAPSAMHTLNRAVAMAEWRGPIEGLAILEGLQPPSWLAGSYLWAAVLTDLHRRCGHDELAKRYRDAALASAPSLPVKNALARRLRTEDSWGPRPVTCSYAEVDLRVGGGYRIVNALPDGTSVVIEGEFEQIEPPHKLVYTWRMGPEHPELSRVTVHFEARGDATEVIVVHEQIASRALRDSHEHGWRGCLDGLARHFA